MEEKKKAGGAREGAGRKPKADEIKLIDTMDAICVPDAIWAKLAEKAASGDTNAIKTWLSYRYGMPKQTVDTNTNLTVDSFNLKDVIKFDNTKQ